MKTLDERVYERMNQEMDSRGEQNARRISQLGERFARMEQQGLVTKDRYEASTPTALTPMTRT